MKLGISITIIVFSLFFIFGFKFNSDAPKNRLWRSVYVECYQTCLQELSDNKKHWCNMHCVRVADEAFYKMEKEEKINKSIGSKLCSNVY